MCSLSPKILPFWRHLAWLERYRSRISHVESLDEQEARAFMPSGEGIISRPQTVPVPRRPSVVTLMFDITSVVTGVDSRRDLFLFVYRRRYFCFRQKCTTRHGLPGLFRANLRRNGSSVSTVMEGAFFLEPFLRCMRSSICLDPPGVVPFCEFD